MARALPKPSSRTMDEPVSRTMTRTLSVSYERGTPVADRFSAVGVAVALAPFRQARLLFSKSHDWGGTNGSKKRPHDAYPVRCRVAGYYEPSIEGVRVCQLKKSRQLGKCTRLRYRFGAVGVAVALRPEVDLRKSTVNSKSTFMEKNLRSAKEADDDDDQFPTLQWKGRACESVLGAG